MKTRLLAITLGIAMLVAAGCKTLPPSIPTPDIPDPEARAAMQTHIYTNKFDTVFSATLAVLQDLDWQLDTTDKPAGLIRATTARRSESLGPEDEKTMNLEIRKKTVESHADITRKWSRWTEVVIHTEPWSGDRVRQRIVMNLRGTLPAMSYSEEQGGSLFKSGRMVTIHAPPEEQSVPVAIREVYGDLFDRIDKAIRLRQGL